MAVTILVILGMLFYTAMVGLAWSVCVIASRSDDDAEEMTRRALP